MRCPNGALLTAIRNLALVERDKVLQRVSYVDLGVDELGSIYEALLDYQPRISTTAEEVPVDPDGKSVRAVGPGEFFLDPRGLSRKSSGTYYTNPQLVDRLIQSALVPVLEERLEQAGDDPSEDSSCNTLRSHGVDFYSDHGHVVFPLHILVPICTTVVPPTVVPLPSKLL